MPNHTHGASYSFGQLAAAYHADPQAENDAHFLLCKGEDILALCLRQQFNPKQDEVWVGNDPIVAKWGEKLAGLGTVPVYYSERGRQLFQYKGVHQVTSDTQDPAELSKRRGSVGLSRVVFIKPLPQPKAP